MNYPSSGPLDSVYSEPAEWTKRKRGPVSMRFRTYPPRRLVAYAVYLALVAALLILFFHALVLAGYPDAGGDGFGHLYKIWKVWRSGYVGWASEWYTSYPFERFYPPLTYLLGGLYAALAHSAAAGYNLVTLTAMLFSLVTMYWTTKKLGMEFHASAVASVVYTFSIRNVMMPIGGLAGYIDAGGLARYLATALAPLLPLAIISFKNRMKAQVAAGLVISGLMLTHHTLLVTASYASLVIVAALCVLKAGRLKAGFIRRAMTGTPIVFGVVVLVTAFWLIPLMVDFGYASFRSENTNPVLYQMHSLSVENAVMIRGETWVTCHAFIYHIIATATPFSAVVTRKRRALTASTLISIAYWVAIGLSMGANGPLTTLNQLPFMTMIQVNRWADALPLLAAFQAAFLVTNMKTAFKHLPTPSLRNLFPVIWAVILFLPAVTVSPYSHEYTSFQLSDNFVATLQFISNHTHPTERVYPYGVKTTEGSIIGYTPALTGIKSVEGWYRQGDPLDHYRVELYWSITEAPQQADALLEAYGVKHVLLDLRHPLHERAYQGLTSIGFEEAFTRNPYLVMSKDNTAYLTPIGNALAIGDEWAIRSALETPSLHVSYLGREIPEDLNHEMLTEYDVLILQGYHYDSQDWMENLNTYVQEGGIVIADPYKSPDQTCNNLLGFGIKTVTLQVMGPLESIDSINNASWMSTYSWNEDVWEGCTFEDSGITELLRIGPYPGIGRIQKGRGCIVLVGMNMMFHGLYTNDMRNIEALRTTVNNILKDTTECAAQRVQDEHINLNTSSTRPATIRVSETWFPYWDVYVDGHYDGRADQDPTAGVMVIHAPPGEHTISLIFHDPFRPLRYLSLIGSIITVLYIILPENALQRSFKQLVKRIQATALPHSQLAIQDILASTDRDAPKNSSRGVNYKPEQGQIAS